MDRFFGRGGQQTNCFDGGAPQQKIHKQTRHEVCEDHWELKRQAVAQRKVNDCLLVVLFDV